MILYLSGHVRDGVHAMLTPRMGQRPPRGMLWAADTGLYSQPSFSFAAYLVWLNELADALDRNLFATAPDRPGDAVATMAMARPTFPFIRELGYQVALCAQDGLESLDVPWDEFDWLFIGGTTAWKWGPRAEELAAEAIARGKPVHVGRVNSGKRLRQSAAMGATSADGTFLRFGPDVNEARMRRWLAELEDRPNVWRPAEPAELSDGEL